MQHGLSAIKYKWTKPCANISDVKSTQKFYFLKRHIADHNGWLTSNNRGFRWEQTDVQSDKVLAYYMP